MALDNQDIVQIQQMIQQHLRALQVPRDGGIVHREIKRLEKKLNRGNNGPTPADDMCCFVYQEGGVAAGNVYSSWPALMNAVGAVEGAKSIVIDDTISSPAVVPAGAWDLNGSDLVGLNNEQPANLQISDGATLSNVDSIAGNLTVTSLSTAAAILVAAGESLAIRDQAIVFSQDTGSTPAMIDLGDNATLIIETGAAVQATEDDPVITVANTESANILMGSSAVLTDDALTGAGDYAITLSGDAEYGRAHPNNSGTRTLTFEDEVQEDYVSLGAGLLPFIGHVLATGDLDIPLATESRGPIVVRADQGTRTLSATGADTVNGGASISVRRNACAVLKSDGTSAWINLCSLAGVSTLQGMSGVIASFATGTDYYLGVVGASTAGAIDVTGTIGVGSQFVVPFNGRVSRIALQSDVTIDTGDTVEIFRILNGGARTVIASGVQISSAPATVVVVPSVETALAEGDVVEFGLALATGGPVASVTLHMTVELEWD